MRAEGKRYAQKLREAGVKIEEYFVEGAPHAYDLRMSSKRAQKFISKRVEAFKEAFDSVEK